jgi:phosphatidylglycerophosphate synthase
MFDEPFRARFARSARPVARALAGAGVTPNQITVTACAIGVIAAMLVAGGYPHWGLAFWLVSRLLDGLDGVVAREAGLATAFGGYLDITLDMTAYAAMVWGFTRLHPAYALAWAAVLAGYVVVITTTLALSDAATAMSREVSATDRTFQFTPGFTEAGETTVMYALWIVFPAHVGWLAWVWAAALFATAVQRSLLAWRTLR